MGAVQHGERMETWALRMCLLHGHQPAAEVMAGESRRRQETRAYHMAGVGVGEERLRRYGSTD